MNKVIQIGRLTRDPEIRYSNTANGQTCIAKWSIAVDRRFKREGQPDADFFNCQAFGKTAEFIEKYLKKGSKIAIEGSLQNNNWEKDGVKHYDIVINVEQVEFAESKNAGTAPAAPVPTPATDADGFMQVPEGLDDELPFA